MKATVNYISKSGNSASISVKQQIGIISQTISGFVGIPETNKDLLDDDATKIVVGSVIDIPAKSVRTEVRKGEDGTPFNFLIFEVQYQGSNPLLLALHQLTEIILKPYVKDRNLMVGE